MIIKYKKLDKNAVMFKKQTDGSTGFDITTPETVTIAPGELVAVPTGIALDLTGLPSGVELQIRPRSGLSSKGIIMLNAPGTIDRDYTGEIKVLMTNLTKEVYTIEAGSRVAQAVFAMYVPYLTAFPVEELSKTERGAGGFGSTGV